MRLSSKASKKFLPLVLSSAIATVITGCNGGGSDSSDSNGSTPAPTPAASQVEVPVDSVFAAMLRTKVDHTPSGASAAVTYYDAELVALNTETNSEVRFEWPMVVDEAGMAASQKTVTLLPGTYNFTLSVTKGSEQYIAMLAEHTITDAEEVRLNLELEPVIGQTIVDIEAVMQPSQLTLEYPPGELAAIDDPVIGITIDGEEHLFSINKTTGIADILLSIPEGSHTYEVKLYNGNILIGRSEVGAQTLDLAAEGDSFDIDIISLQADVTVETTEFNEPFFTFNIPADVIDHIGDVNLVNLNVRLVDDAGVEQEQQLTITEEDGRYYAQHLFDSELTAPVTAYIQFLDLTSGTATEFASCNDTITIGAQTGNTVSCGVGVPIDSLNIGGNLLATLSINVLNQNGEAQSGAEVFVDGQSKGITGSNFGTPGFIKVYVKAGESHTVRAAKNGLEASVEKTPTALDINNFDLTLADSTPVTGFSCKSIYDSGNSVGDGLYTLTIGGEDVETWCDMSNGGWTLVMRAYGGSLTSDWIDTKRGALNVTADKSPDMTETFKFSDTMINTLHEGRQRYRIISDYNARSIYSAGSDYCHDIANECQTHLGTSSPLEAYMGVYPDESLDPATYEDGLNSDSYVTIRGGIATDTRDGKSIFIMSYSTYGGRGWSLGGGMTSGFCMGLEDGCDFSMWVK